VDRAGAEAAVAADAAVVESALGWSSRQAHILTGGGKAEELYSAARGYAYADNELPHYHLSKGTSHMAFANWAAEAKHGAERAEVSAGAPLVNPPEWLAGVWARPLFSGGGLVSTDADEHCVNLVTAHGPFVDIRIPTARDALLGDPSSSRWTEVAKAVASGAPRPLATLSDLEVSPAVESSSPPGLPPVA